MTSSPILVTGGAGYIGSHTVLALKDAGYSVVVLDDLSTGHAQLVPEDVLLVRGSVGDGALLDALFDTYDFAAILHFAGSIVVGESVSDPLKYYQNNTANTRTLLAAALAAGVPNFIFSSTAAVYGEPKQVPIDESAARQPINPYGNSKLMTEMMLEDIAASGAAMRYGILRYFNVAGADAQGRSGQMCDNATHLVKIASEAAMGKREGMGIFGTDYPTEDGTCIRDYIHVSDLAAAHVVVLENLLAGGKSLTLNAGYGHGFSVREVIASVQKTSGVDFAVSESPRRAGDPAQLISDPAKLLSLGWKPEHDDIDLITRSAYQWEAALMKKTEAA